MCLFEGVLTLDCDNRFTITVNVFPLYCALFCCRLSLLTAVGYGTVVDVHCIELQSQLKISSSTDAGNRNPSASVVKSKSHYPKLSLHKAACVVAASKTKSNDTWHTELTVHSLYFYILISSYWVVYHRLTRSLSYGLSLRSGRCRQTLHLALT